MFTLKSPLKFINRVLNLPEYRLGHLLISKIQINNSFWIKGWENSENKFNLNDVKSDIYATLHTKDLKLYWIDVYDGGR